jgi:hypothetical protein
MRNATLRPAVKPAKPSSPAADTGKPLRHLRWTLIILVLVLVFEGLCRKLEPNRIGVFIFLLKDFIIVAMGFQLFLRHRLSPAIHFVSAAYFTIIVLFLPCILATASHDPILAIFGAKEYLLYPIVALGIFTVFESATVDQIVGFCRMISLLMIPTGLVAMLQTTLPATHWLNLSVAGGSLEDFTSAGHLRVSSTFSFVAQFCDFLNMQMFMVFLALHGWQKLKTSRKLLYLLPIPFLVVCSYLTGSRGAVVGNTAIFAIAIGLMCLRFELGKVFHLVGIALGIGTYSVREEGHVLGISPEIQERVYRSFFGWMADAGSMPFFGNGLGIMSNGSDILSAYSRTFRSQGWTETDMATTLFEGGLYLILVWYGFRYYMIYQTMRRFLFQVSPDLSTPAAFCQAYVILVGITGTLGIQPPTAIWWWLAIGLSATLWWRSVNPIAAPEAPAAPVAAAPRPSRGRSAYAEQLHGRHEKK